MATTSITIAETPLVRFSLSRADDALVLGHRLSEWTGSAPMLEEELALANLGLDLIGQARSLYAYAAEREGAGHDEDQYAYLRDAPCYRNLLLVEQPNGDFAHTIVRQVLYSAFADPYWRAMIKSNDPTLAAIAAKSEKESAYHLRHASEWLIRLGDGTEESHRRAAEAVETLWPYHGELFEADESEAALVAEGAAIDPASLRHAWDATLDVVLTEATLKRPTQSWTQRGWPRRAAQRASGPSAGRDAASAAHLPRGHLVSASADLRARAWSAAAEVVDPEIPVLTIADLGVLRDVTIDDTGTVEVAITPTYSGCPAMNMIALEVELALARAGLPGSRVRTVLSPAWTTDWMTEAGRQKLQVYGIAPPPPPGTGRGALFGNDAIACPKCGSLDTERLAEFGSTSCKSLWRCRSCREPFDHFKCH